MKKLLLVVFITSSLCSCSVFQKQEKYGCPTSGSAVGAEKILAGDQKAIKASSKSKYKGGRKSY